jgi:hypothetical protein
MTILQPVALPAIAAQRLVEQVATETPEVALAILAAAAVQVPPALGALEESGSRPQH